MSVRFNNEASEILTLIGGGPQGILLGGLEYIVLGNDNSDCVDSKDRFKYIDDFSILQLIFLSGLLVEHEFMQRIPSDIGADVKYLELFNSKSLELHLKLDKGKQNEIN